MYSRCYRLQIRNNGASSSLARDRNDRDWLILTTVSSSCLTIASRHVSNTGRVHISRHILSSLANDMPHIHVEQLCNLLWCVRVVFWLLFIDTSSSVPFSLCFSSSNSSSLFPDSYILKERSYRHLAFYRPGPDWNVISYQIQIKCLVVLLSLSFIIIIIIRN